MTSRWFIVTAERFDWMPSPSRMVSRKRGQYGYGTRECIAEGLRLGAIQICERPEGYRVDKAGRVVKDAD